MKKIFLAFAILGFGHFAFAQDEPKTDKQNQEIIICDKGDKDIKMTVEINGDSILINGKPLNEFLDSEVT